MELLGCGGGRILGVGACVTFLILMLSASCVVSKAMICSSGFYTPTKSNDVKLSSSIAGSSNLLPVSFDEDKGGQSASVMTTTTSISTSTNNDSEPVRLTVYSENNFSGHWRVLTFNGTECQDLPPRMLNRVKSLNTHGNCIKLCDYERCQGFCMTFKPGSPHHNRLRKHRFHNQAESAYPCPQQ